MRLLLLLLLIILLPQAVHAQTLLDDIPTATDLLEQILNGTYPNLSGGEGGEGGGLGGGLGNITDLANPDIIGQLYSPRTLSQSPENVGESQAVTISIADQGRTVNFSEVRWYVDERLHSSGIGQRNITLITGAFGETVSVYAEIISPEGALEVTAPLVVGPTRIDVLWEAADAIVPPFYKGKALPSWDSIVRLYAIPHTYSRNGVKIPQSSFVFTWEKNSRLADLGEQSGYGKNAIFALADFTRIRHSFIVRTLNTQEQASSIGAVTVQLRDSDIVLYEKHPLYGIIYERALSSNNLLSASNPSFRVVAYPLGIDKRNTSDVLFQWNVNGAAVSSTGRMGIGEFPVTIDAASQGRATILVEARNQSNLHQRALKTLSITVQ